MNQMLRPTLGWSLAKDKELIRNALDGRIRTGLDHNGYIYEEGTKEECNKAILDTFDTVVCQLLATSESLSAMENVIHKDMNISAFSEEFRTNYMKRMSEEDEKDWEYEFESIEKADKEPACE